MINSVTKFGYTVHDNKQEEKQAALQKAVVDIKKKFGKNAILNGGSYLEGATAKERNKQIGGHKA